MQASWLKPNHYTVKNGKLIPRSSTPTQSKNYRYIPYDPVNKPGPQDYYKQTISRLNKENSELKKTLQEVNLIPKQLQFSSRNREKEIFSLSGKVANLSKLLIEREKELRSKDDILREQNQIITHQGNQLNHLHYTLSAMQRQISELVAILNKRDEEIMQKNEMIEQYEKTIEKMTVREQKGHKHSKTMNTDYNSAIEKSAEKSQNDSMQFHTMEGRSWTQERSIPNQHYKHKTSPFDEDFEQHQRIFNEKLEPVDREDKKSACSSELSENLNNWSKWAGNNQISTLDYLAQSSYADHDPIAGSLSSFFSSLIKK